MPARMSARHRPVDLAGPRPKIATADRLVHQEHAAPGPRRQLQHVLGIGQILRRASLAYQRKAGSVGHIRRHAVPTVVDYVEVWLPQLEVFQVEGTSVVGVAVVGGSVVVGVVVANGAVTISQELIQTGHGNS